MHHREHGVNLCQLDFCYELILCFKNNVASLENYQEQYAMRCTLSQISLIMQNSGRVLHYAEPLLQCLFPDLTYTPHLCLALAY